MVLIAVLIVGANRSTIPLLNSAHLVSLVYAYGQPVSTSLAHKPYQHEMSLSRHPFAPAVWT
jgi:hypothetical protein